MKKALITGITGQDGSYLAELLLAKDYEVHGLVRRASAYNRSRIDHLRDPSGAASKRLLLHYGELSEAGCFHRLLTKIQPDEIYHLAGQSHVGLSFDLPEVTCMENGMATVHLLEAMRELKSDARLYLAVSSEVFGAPEQEPQDEATPCNPTNPYGAAKTMALNLGRIYREAHGLFIANGIAYNHESPRRGENFVTRKIALGVARIANGQEGVIELGNLDGCRDWGYAPEYVDCMWRMLQAERGDEYVIATGETHTVRDFTTAAFAAADIALEWRGEETSEIAVRQDTGTEVVRVVEKFFRPVDPIHLRGNAGKAWRLLKWKARTLAPELAAVMVRAELAEL
jgi:GDPmannose 4,6-dehydratase